MDLILTNLYTEQVYPLVGSPMKVEEKLRELFKGMFDTIPIGDLSDVLWVLGRMHGWHYVIDNEADFQPTKRPYRYRPEIPDVWDREIDSEPLPAYSK